MLVNREWGIECVGTESVNEQRVGDRMCRVREWGTVCVSEQNVLGDRMCLCKKEL